MVGEDTNTAAQRKRAPTQGCHQFTIYKTLFQEHETTQNTGANTNPARRGKTKKTTAIDKAEFVLVVL